MKWSGKELRKIGIMGLSGFKKRIEEKTAEEWFELGLEEKDPKKKIEYYSKCLKLDPKNADAWHNIGSALDDLGRYEEAIRCYDRALEIDPRDVVVWNNKGVALTKLGKYNEAIRCFDKALDIDPLYVRAENYKKLAIKELSLIHI